MERFMTTYSCITSLNEKFAIQAYIAGVANESVQLALCGNYVEDMEGLINKAYKLSNTQEMNKNRAPHTQQYDKRRMDIDRGSQSSQISRIGHLLESSR